MLPSSVFVGAMGMVLDRSRANSWSISSRSSVKFCVSDRLLVLVRTISSLPFWLVLVVMRSNGVVGVDELDREPTKAVGFSLLFNAVVYEIGSSKSAFSSGYWKYLLPVAHRIICPMGASLIVSAIASTSKQHDDYTWINQGGNDARTGRDVVQIHASTEGGSRRGEYRKEEMMNGTSYIWFYHGD